MKGYTQRSGIDYKETFAPTPRSGTGRIMLALAHRFRWHRRQGDVLVTFLNPDLDVHLYMEIPDGYKEEGKIMFLRKGLYGLQQAGALWHDNVKALLGHLGLLSTVSDVFLCTIKQKNLFLLYVDDFQVMGPDLTKIENLIHALHNKYKLKIVKTDLFLGINKSNPDKSTLKLSQG